MKIRRSDLTRTKIFGVANLPTPRVGSQEATRSRTRSHDERIDRPAGATGREARPSYEPRAWRIKRRYEAWARSARSPSSPTSWAGGALLAKIGRAHV